MVGRTLQVMRTSRRMLLQRIKKVVEALDRRLETLHVEGQGCVAGLDRKEALNQDLARVGLGGHPVPSDTVLGFTSEEGPIRGVQSPVSWQRSVVKIDGAAAW